VSHLAARHGRRERLWRRARAQRHRASRAARIARLGVVHGGSLLVTRLRQLRADPAERAELDRRFAVRTATDVTAQLGQMKGVLMKAGQLIGFIAEGLPEEAKAVLATLQADAPPMAPSLAASVVRAELGGEPDRIFRHFEPVPVAAASIGQVHRAVLHDGRQVAVKVQYPGVGETIGPDLANAELLYGLVARFSVPGLDTKAFVDELRARMLDELDYRIEAANLVEFGAHYAGHPFIRIPEVIAKLCSERVLTTSWVDGLRFDEFVATASVEAKQRAGEVLFRFAQGSVHRVGAFNGDPHPGNYRFHPDGTITFLDFGLVKRWEGDEWERLSPCVDAIITLQDPVQLVARMEAAGFLERGHGLDPADVYAYVSSPYRPYLTDSFTFTPAFVADALAKVLDVRGPYEQVVRALNMPSSFVILDRVVWGVSSLLGRLGASGPWRDILAEYRHGGPPATELGCLDAAWWAARAR
jgi:predicted unusual protein kinase regulating ubiquinone biosynthesis (AarF/ABC1/UbiB family)